MTLDGTGIGAGVGVGVGAVHKAPPLDDAAQALALGFARQIERWALAHDVAPPVVALARQAALALGLATSEGHVCIDLAQAIGGMFADIPGDIPGDSPADIFGQMPADTSADMPDGVPDGGPHGGPHDVRDGNTARAALLASGVVGTPAAPQAMPMILDGDNRLYLHRYFDHERRLATRLVQAAAVPVDANNGAAARAQLAELFPRDAANHAGGDHQAVDWQQAAAALALRSRLAIISGGPGTGKTTTVVKLLACLLAQQPDARIALTAPTGKAAARMGQAMRERAALLPLSDAVRARLPGQASTVHRLLGVTPGPGGFVHDAGNLLAIDVLVVDEASMLDLALATRLLEAVPPHARIVLLGDKDQLSAVESGSVFAEISADPSLSTACAADLEALCGLAPGSMQPPAGAARPAAGALQDTVVWFTQNFRFAADSGIGRLAAATNGGRAAQAVQILRDAAAAGAPDGSVRWLADGDRLPGAAVWQQLLDGYAPFIDALRRDPCDVAAVTLAFNRFRALCAVREGPRGALAANAQAALAVRSALGGPSAANMQNEWYPGRPVMVLRNDPVLKLFNGDVGIALPGGNAPDGALMVYFPAADRATGLAADRSADRATDLAIHRAADLATKLAADLATDTARSGSGWRAVPPLRLPAHQTAFAMTVHKAQGSEFDTVLVLLPDRRSRVVTRELLYTAVTRARQRVVLCAGAEVIATAIQSPTQRRSGLAARLAEAAAASQTAPPP